jgi:hypothetical protein
LDTVYLSNRYPDIFKVRGSEFVRVFFRNRPLELLKRLCDYAFRIRHGRYNQEGQTTKGTNNQEQGKTKNVEAEEKAWDEAVGHEASGFLRGAPQ